MSARNGKEFRTSGTAHGGTTLKYVARKSDCASCPLKANCTRGSARHVSRDVNEEARDYARALTTTEAYRVSARQRKMIETGFGDLKSNLGLTRLRLRGGFVRLTRPEFFRCGETAFRLPADATRPWWRSGFA